MAIVVPVVFADAVNQAMKTSLKMAMLADDVTDQVAEITECGDTVNFPKYDRVADIKEITKGTAVMLSRKLNDALSSGLFYAHFDSHRDISHFKSSCFCELFF